MSADQIEIKVYKKNKLVETNTFYKPQIIIGKDKGADIKLSGFSVSKKHAKLLFQNNVWSLIDLSSMTGTYINDERIIEYNDIQTNDTIHIHDYTMKFSFCQDPKKPDSDEDNHFRNNTAAAQIPLLTRSVGPNNHVFEQKIITQQNNNTQNIHTIAPQTQIHMALFNEWRQILHEKVVETFDLRRQDISELSEQDLRAKTTELAMSIVQELPIPKQLSHKMLMFAVVDDIVGLGPLETLLQDPGISEIMVNCADEIFVEKNGRIEKSHFTFSNDAAVLAVIDRIITPLGRRIDQSSPMVDARLKDGSRVNAIIPPLAIKGPCITIRKFPSKRLTIDDLIGFGSMNEDMATFFKVAVSQGKNILVSGGTGTGKTTLLNVLSNLIPVHERVITIEDAAELQINLPDLVSLESKPANLEGSGAIHIRDLVKNALRMRPNRIVVGECRGAEALDMLQAMNTGHDGSLTTLHANTPRDALSRLEVMVMMAGMEIPVQAIREQMSSAIDIIVQQTRFPCGSRKITYVTEVVGMEAGIIQLQDIYQYKRQRIDQSGKIQGHFKPTGFIPSFYEELAEYGHQMDTSIYTSQHI